MLANLRKNIETIAKPQLLYVAMKRQNHNILGLWGWGIMCNFAADMKKTNETIAALLLMALAPNAAFAATNCGVTGNNGMEEITGTKVTEKGIIESMVAEKVVTASKASEKEAAASKASEKEAAASLSLIHI